MAQLKSSLIMCNVPTVDSAKAQAFYGALLGTEEFAPGQNPNVESYWTPISRDGIDLTVTQRYDDSERLTPYFAVESLDEAVKQLTELGGEVVQEPVAVSLPSDAKGQATKGRRPRLGRMAVMLDPDRNHVGLMELEDEHAHRHFRVGRHRQGLEEDQLEDLKVARGRSPR